MHSPLLQMLQSAGRTLHQSDSRQANLFSLPFEWKHLLDIPPLLTLLGITCPRGKQGLAFTSVSNSFSNECSTEAYLKLCSPGAPGKMKSLREKFNTSATNAEESVPCQGELSTSVGDVKHSASASACATRSQCVSNFSLQYQQIMWAYFLWKQRLESASSLSVLQLNNFQGQLSYKGTPAWMKWDDKMRDERLRED